ncbi:hypothetical protein TYRP_022601, partial [Tyrophagus putrescentiae]
LNLTFPTIPNSAMGPSPYKCSLCPVPSLADLPDSRLLVVITKKRTELPHVSNAHRTHSSALYSSNLDITSAALSCTSKPAVSTVNIQLPHPLCTASCISAALKRSAPQRDIAW